MIAVVDAAGNATRMSYNARGFKTGMDDPDMGQWTYTHNALGELVAQTDAKGQCPVRMSVTRRWHEWNALLNNACSKSCRLCC